MNTNHANLGLMCGLCSMLAASMLPPCVAALPPDPNNAALLYYQALLRLPDPDLATRNLIHNVLADGQPDARIRSYIEDHRGAIAYAERAAEITECDWGTWYSRGFIASVLHPATARFLSEVLGVDAQILAADGDYRAAFGRCLTIRALARHTNSATSRSYTAALYIEHCAQRCVSQILGRMPPDVDTILWLKSQLAAAPRMSASPVEAAVTDLEFLLHRVRTDDEMLEWIRQRVAGNVGSTNTPAAQDLTDEELVAHLRELGTEFLDPALAVISADRPYEEAYAAIQALLDTLDGKVSSDPIGRHIRQEIMNMADRVLGLYACQVQITAHFHAFSAAIEIYLWRATTGGLPRSLPDGLPKDPYSGRDFEYMVTEDGFVLRARAEDIRHEETKEYHFKVK